MVDLFVYLGFEVVGCLDVVFRYFVLLYLYFDLLLCGHRSVPTVVLFAVAGIKMHIYNGWWFTPL